MVDLIKGDALGCRATLVGHQVNSFGVMGAGIAAVIYPLLTAESKDEYIKKCQQIESQPSNDWLGDIQIMQTKRAGLTVCNLFTQAPYITDDGSLTVYPAMRCALRRMEHYARQNHHDVVAVPARIGCGIAGGNWQVVQDIIHSVFDNSPIQMLIVDNQ